MAKEFRFLDEVEKYRGYVMRVTKSRFADPDGGEFTRDIVYSPGAVGVVPVTEVDGTYMVTMVRQYRAPLRTNLLEVPAGLRDKPGEDPEEVGRRELIEEVGLIAGSMTPLTSFLNAAGMTDQRTWLYLAENLTPTDRAADGAEEQWMTIETHPLDELVASTMAGSASTGASANPMVDDAKTVIGLLLAQKVLAERSTQ